MMLLAINCSWMLKCVGKKTLRKPVTVLGKSKAHGLKHVTEE